MHTDHPSQADLLADCEQQQPLQVRVASLRALQDTCCCQPGLRTKSPVAIGQAGVPGQAPQKQPAPRNLHKGPPQAQTMHQLTAAGSPSPRQADLATCTNTLVLPRRSPNGHPCP